MLSGTMYDLSCPCFAVDNNPGSKRIVALWTERNDTGYQVASAALTAREIELDVDELPLPQGIVLEVGYPNPFNSATTITYELERRQYVSLKIFDLLGREIRTLAEGEVSAGRHSLMFDAKDLASGAYFCRLTAGRYSLVRKLVLLR